MENSRTVATQPEAGEDALAQVWDEVDRSWEDPEAHRRALALAQATRRLGDLGRRYRAEIRERPERRAVAERNVERILALAMQELVDAREPVPVAPRRLVHAIGYAVAIGLALVAAMLLLRGRS